MARENSANSSNSPVARTAATVAHAADKVASVARNVAGDAKNGDCDCGKCAECRAKVGKLAPIYAVAIASVIIAAACGAITVGMGIAFLTGHAVAFPGVVGLLLGVTDKLVAPVALGLFGALAGVVALVAFGKIKKSPDTECLVKSGAYRAITAVGVIVASFAGAMFAIYAVATALATLLALQNGLPWATYYLGQFVPTLLLGLALIATALLIGGFAKAKVSSLVVWLVPWLIALVGLVLVAVAVGVKSHSSDAGAIFGTASYATSTSTTTTTNSTKTNSTKNSTNKNNNSSSSCSGYTDTGDLIDAYYDGDINYSTYSKCVQQLLNY